jgi:hypothetical protein
MQRRRSQVLTNGTSVPYKNDGSREQIYDMDNIGSGELGHELEVRREVELRPISEEGSSKIEAREEISFKEGV